jgi:hypothetical protein
MIRPVHGDQKIVFKFALFPVRGRDNKIIWFSWYRKVYKFDINSGRWLYEYCERETNE